MATYLLVFHGGAAPATPEEREETTAAWMRWYGEMGDAAVDRGNPIAQTKTVAPDGSVTDGGGANPANGYAILGAESLDAAVALARGCPHLATGGSVEVAETFEVM